MITIIFWEAVYLLWGVIFSGRGGGWGGESRLFTQPFSFSFSWENFVPRLLSFLYIIISTATGFFTFFQGFEERTFKWNCIQSLSLFCFFFLQGSGGKWAYRRPQVFQLNYNHDLPTQNMVVLPFSLFLSANRSVTKEFIGKISCECAKNNKLLIVKWPFTWTN